MSRPVFVPLPRPEPEPAPVLAPVAKLPFGGRGPRKMDWDHPLPHMQEFLDELASGDGARSQDYVRMVRVALMHFSNFAHEEGIKHPAEIERAHVLRFQAYLTTVRSTRTGQPLKQQYRIQMLKYLRNWINWMKDLDLVDGDPWVRIHVGRVKKQPKPLTPGEVVELFGAHRAQSFSLTPFVWHRRGVILTLLLGWGLRIHELASLNVSQMVPVVDFVTVPNKGGDTKTLPYSKAMKGEVLRWLTHRARNARHGEDALLITQTGERLPIARIRTIVEEIGQRANVALTPHRLRDTFCTIALEAGMTIEDAMKLSGHKSRTMFMGYADIRNQRLAEEHAKHINPLLDQLLTGRESGLP